MGFRQCRNQAKLVWEGNEDGRQQKAQEVFNVGPRRKGACGSASKAVDIGSRSGTKQ